MMSLSSSSHPYVRLYQPAPRYWHSTVVVGYELYLWGGVQRNLPAVCTSEEKKRFLSVVDVFELKRGCWQQRSTHGTPPRGVGGYSCAVTGRRIHYFGGWCGSKGCYHNNLTTLSTELENMQWEETTPNTSEGAGPMIKGNCGMVSFESASGQQFLHVVGGFGRLPSVRSPQFMYTPHNEHLHLGWTNENHIFSLERGQWILPTVTGQAPPPCSHFSYTLVDKRKAVMYGGEQPHLPFYMQYFGDMYVAELTGDSVHWVSVASRPPLWPEGRVNHAACCITTLQLMVVGGEGNDEKTLSDSFVMSVTAAVWTQIDKLSNRDTQRQYHSLSVFSLTPHCVWMVVFGGVGKFLRGEFNKKQPMIDDTVVIELISCDGEWSVGTVFSIDTLGSMEYLQRLVDRILVESAYQGSSLQGANRWPNHQSIDTSSLGTVSDTSVPVRGLQDAPPQHEFMSRVVSKISSQWRMFGSLLNISVNDLNAVDDKHRGDPRSSFLEVYSLWQSSPKRPFTWETVVGVLEGDLIGEKALANKLKAEL